jgi:hypothetical protein
VPQVNTVEHADGDDGASPGFRYLTQAHPALHDACSFAVRPAGWFGR